MTHKQQRLSLTELRELTDKLDDSPKVLSSTGDILIEVPPVLFPHFRKLMIDYTNIYNRDTENFVNSSKVYKLTFEFQPSLRDFGSRVPGLQRDPYENFKVTFDTDLSRDEEIQQTLNYTYNAYESIIWPAFGKIRDNFIDDLSELNYLYDEIYYVNALYSAVQTKVAYNEQQCMGAGYEYEVDVYNVLKVVELAASNYYQDCPTECKYFDKWYYENIVKRNPTPEDLLCSPYWEQTRSGNFIYLVYDLTGDNSHKVFTFDPIR